MLYKQSRSQYRYQNGPFSIVPNLPGYAIPEHRDHGYGPLARFDDTTLEPGGFVPMHEHRNDEIITYITDGLVRHADSSGARLVASPTKIMVMNAGKSFGTRRARHLTIPRSVHCRFSCALTPSTSSQIFSSKRSARHR